MRTRKKKKKKRETKILHRTRPIIFSNKRNDEDEKKDR